MRVYLDASVLVSLFTNDVHTGRADAILRSNTPAVIVSDFAAAEFASAVARRVRTGDLTREEARNAFAAFDIWLERTPLRAEVTTADVARAIDFLRRLDLPLRTPDALNIAIAQRLECHLITFDEQMVTNARALASIVLLG